MKLIKGTDNARFIIDSDNYSDKKISDKFDIAGKICSIVLMLNIADGTIPFKIKIGGLELTNDDFVIEEYYSWELAQIIKKGNYRKSREIEFTKNDVFQVQDNCDNIWRIILWVSEINGKNLVEEHEEHIRKIHLNMKKP